MAELKETAAFNEALAVTGSDYVSIKRSGDTNAMAVG